MAKNDNLQDFLTDVADAIRAKKGTTDKINPQDFSSEIASIQSGDVQMPNVSGTLVITEGITEEDYEALKLILGNNITIDAQGGIYIHFEDPEVLRVLLDNITTDDGVGLTREDIEGVTTIRTWFNKNTTIKTFNELRYFNLESIVNAAFYGCTNFEEVTLPNIKILEDLSFMNCSKLRISKLPNTIEKIGLNTFYGCISLAVDVNLPNLQSIGSGAFESSGVTKVSNLGLITSLVRAFWNCTSLKSVILPPTTTTIGAGSFNRCSALEWLKITSTSVVALDNINAFSGTTCIIYVLDELVSEYKTATNWSGLGDRIKGISEMPTE